MHGRSYEFTANENQTVGRAALWARALGIVLIVQGVFGLRDLPEQPVGSIVGLFFALAVGVVFIQGGSAFDRVVNTQGDDLRHMMQALTKLTTAFTIRIALMIIVLVLLGLGLLIGACVVASRT